MFNMFMHMKLQYLLLQELASIEGADTGNLAHDGAEEFRSYVITNFALPKKTICELAPLLQTAVDPCCLNTVFFQNM